jgi:hypothetical protein
MTAGKQFQLVSVADYLAGELTSDTKHEYSGGYVYRRLTRYERVEFTAGEA